MNKIIEYKVTWNDGCASNTYHDEDYALERCKSIKLFDRSAKCFKLVYKLDKKVELKEKA